MSIAHYALVSFSRATSVSDRNLEGGFGSFGLTLSGQAVDVWEYRDELARSDATLAEIATDLQDELGS